MSFARSSPPPPRIHPSAPAPRPPLAALLALPPTPPPALPVPAVRWREGHQAAASDRLWVSKGGREAPSACPPTSAIPAPCPTSGAAPCRPASPRPPSSPCPLSPSPSHPSHRHPPTRHGPRLRPSHSAAAPRLYSRNSREGPEGGRRPRLASQRTSCEGLGLGGGVNEGLGAEGQSKGQEGYEWCRWAGREG